MDLIVVYAICSSVLAVIVWTTIIITKIQDYRQQRHMKARARRAWRELKDVQRLTSMMLRGSVKEDTYE